MRVRTLLTLLATVAVVGGCGSSSHPAAAKFRPGAKLTTQKFSAELDQVCKVNTLSSAAYPKPQTVAQLVATLEQVMPGAKREYREQADLRPPAAYRAVYRNFLSIARRELTLTETLLTAARADNVDGMRTIATEAQSLNAPNDVDSHVLHVNWCLSTVTGTTTTTTPVPTSTLAA